jgi:hypothetical protein
MPNIYQQANGAWGVVSSDGTVLFSDLTNAQAWRKLDILSNEATSAAHAAKDFAEKKPRASADEMQDFYSGLLQIEQDRSYKSGWAWVNFIEKYKIRPDGLHCNPCKPSKSVWAFVNRRAIARSKK